jgi:hypothetical protein
MFAGWNLLVLVMVALVIPAVRAHGRDALLGPADAMKGR